MMVVHNSYDLVGLFSIGITLAEFLCSLSLIAPRIRIVWPIPHISNDWLHVPAAVCAPGRVKLRQCREKCHNCIYYWFVSIIKQFELLIQEFCWSKYNDWIFIQLHKHSFAWLVHTIKCNNTIITFIDQLIFANIISHKILTLYWHS